MVLSSHGIAFSWLQPCFRRTLDNIRFFYRFLDKKLGFSIFILVLLIFDLFYLQSPFEALGQMQVSGPISALEQGRTTSYCPTWML